MRFLLASMLAAGWIGMSGPVLAKDNAIDCDNAMSQMEMTECAYRAWQASDGDLNAVYRDAMKAMKAFDQDLPSDQKGAAKALRDAQRAWIAYRDLACKSEGYQVHGGTMEPQIVFSCKERLTRQRVKDLRQLAEEN